ncbi:MAG: hypothetical protein ACRDTX_31345, partial [Pseudonocardiaceae bacterium]
DPDSAEAAVVHLDPGVVTMVERIFTTPITSELVDQRLEHRVTDEAIAAARSSHRYQALCGQVFVAAPMAAPPGPLCPACAALLVTASRPAGVPEPRRRRQGLLRRWLRPGRPPVR